MSLPKVIIINQPFNNTGGGITLTNLFKGWDKDKIAVASIGAMANLDTSICNTYYRLGQKEHKVIFPLRFLQTKYISGPLTFNKEVIHNPSRFKSSLRTKIIMNYFYPFLKFLGLSHYLSKTQISTEFCNWLDEFQPDILYAQASSREAVLFCLEVQSYLKKPFIFHMMDDWPSIVSDRGLLRKYWHGRINFEFQTLLDKANALMSIGEEMSIEYENRYHKTFIPFQNPINIQFWEKHQKQTYELNDPPTILYAGRIGLGIRTSLESVAKAIQQVNAELHTAIKFIMHTDEKPVWAGSYTCVEHKPLVPHHDLPLVFSQADFLLLPYDFSQKSIKYIKYSMPTKGPEYMISGTPIILFAPEETAVAKYAKKYQFAKVITDNRISEITLAIRQLIESKELRQSLAQRAIKIAEINHNSISVTNHFRKVISSLMNEQ